MDMYLLLVFIFGLVVGSFLNVVICRLKTKESFLFNRSYCPKCKNSLKWYDLIPVFSFLFYRGKCSYCHKKISWQYPLVEIFTGLLFILIVNKFGFDFLFTYYALIIVCLLIVIFVYDLKHYIIPDSIILLGVLVSLGFLIIGGYEILNMFLAGLIASGFFLTLVLITKGKGMGLGDVKLAFLMGLILGWPNILLALFLSFVSGSVIGISLIVLDKKGFKSEIPFGPFLVGATILTMLYGECIIRAYQSFNVLACL